MDEIGERVNRHYGWSGLMNTIEEEIRRNGIDPARVTVDELAPLDNYHWHRLAGTLALARAAAITATDRVLDVGGGIGGPARPARSSRTNSNGPTRRGTSIPRIHRSTRVCSTDRTVRGWARTSGATAVKGASSPHSVCTNAFEAARGDEEPWPGWRGNDGRCRQ